MELLLRLGGDRRADVVILAYYHQWLREDPDLTLRSALSLQADLQEDTNLVGRLTRSWLERDPTAAGTEVRTWEAGPRRDAAIEAIVNYLVQNESSSEAAEWLIAITSDKLRATLRKDLGLREAHAVE